jgi:hypothetical protein
MDADDPPQRSAARRAGASELILARIRREIVSHGGPRPSPEALERQVFALRDELTAPEQHRMTAELYAAGFSHPDPMTALRDFARQVVDHHGEFWAPVPETDAS